MGIIINSNEVAEFEERLEPIFTHHADTARVSAMLFFRPHPFRVGNQTRYITSLVDMQWCRNVRNTFSVLPLFRLIQI